MQRPKPDKRYTFVQLNRDGVEDWLYFVAYSDGSGGIDPLSEKEYRERSKEMELSYAILSSRPWQMDFEILQSENWVEMNQAKRKGLIPHDWEPEDGWVSESSWLND